MAKLEVGEKMPDFGFDTPWEDGLSLYKAAADGGKKYTVVKFLRYHG